MIEHIKPDARTVMHNCPKTGVCVIATDGMLAFSGRFGRVEDADNAQSATDALHGSCRAAVSTRTRPVAMHATPDSAARRRDLHTVVNGLNGNSRL